MNSLSSIIRSAVSRWRWVGYAGKDLRLPLTPGALRFSSSLAATSVNDLNASSSKSDANDANNEDDNSQCRPQRIAIVGAGAVGCYYGARLAVAGHTVHVSVRDIMHRQALRANDGCCQVYSSLTGDVKAPFRGIHSHPQTMQTLASRDPEHPYFDWVLVTLKTTGIKDVMRMVQSVVDEDRTRVILAMNGYGLEKHFARLRCRALYGGCVFVCAERGEPGVVFHSGYSGLAVGVEQATYPEEDHQYLVESLFGGSAVDVYWETSVLHARWKKALINIPINGLSVVKGGLYVNELWAQHKQMIVELMGEVAMVANADMGDMGLSDRITQSDIEKTLKIVEGIGPFKTSTLVDFQRKVPMEFKWMFRLPYERAKALGLYTPCLEWMVTELSYLRDRYKLY